VVHLIARRDIELEHRHTHENEAMLARVLVSSGGLASRRTVLTWTSRRAVATARGSKPPHGLSRRDRGFLPGKYALRLRQTDGLAQLDIKFPTPPHDGPTASTKPKGNFQRTPAPARAFPELLVFLKGPGFGVVSPHECRGTAV
jgi:hypothetical protein